MMSPMIHVIPRGKIKKPDAQGKLSSLLVKSLVYLFFNLTNEEIT